ncbi:phosphodiesterase, MJ0936 family [Caldalkalibacillus thermarum TA2.A1]|uniref:Phosphoesterase n=1 Tax=Caldalkalibacillus thermarum (strain TA2.A1) TaxID=986075 RepID=F5LAF2_CALTT|nr:metallophosphoesterase [Caldalkalibacillus thermarum]EGL81701.1 phosphodiesterase, MJ0936 family [Caldalkalibacillus thermarum TA2.A1]QZT33289.1 metallophosphoesterase [Caldalkalibacillus thermarum TA2.A1]
MARALIISDTHGLTEEVAKAASLFSFDRAFHCGDFCVDENRFPFNKMTLVKGNNDVHAAVPLDQELEWQGIRFFVTHGHTYQVHYSMLQLKYRAQEASAQVVLFGHTHHPVCFEEEGIIYVNPGSFKEPRGFSKPTFILLDIEGDEGDKQLQFTYYDHRYQQVPELSRTFRLRA